MVYKFLKNLNARWDLLVVTEFLNEYPEFSKFKKAAIFICTII